MGRERREKGRERSDSQGEEGVGRFPAGFLEGGEARQIGRAHV